MTIPKEIILAEEGLGSWNILTCYRGSIATNMYVPSTEENSTDDKDVFAVCIPPLDYYLGLKQFEPYVFYKDYGARGAKEVKYKEWDIIIYELKKYLHLLTKGNPNTIMTLFLDEKHYIKKHPLFNKIIENREIFLAKHIYRHAVAYALGQLHKMTHFSNYTEGYMGVKRKKLVEKFGYDTKNAAHCIRLLRMAIEFLNDGVMYVRRHDNNQLLEIKNGEWGIEKIKSEAERLSRVAEDIYLKSKLPTEPDKEKINELCEDILATKFDIF